MDGRGGWVLGFGLLLGGAGCAHQAVSLPQAAVATTAEISKEKPGPSRQPQPATLVAYGNLYERSAAEPNYSSAERDQLLGQARRSYQQALKVDPKNVPATLALARLYVNTNDAEQAVLTYRKALELDGKNAAVWHELGMYQARLKNWQAAVEGLNTAVQLEPSNKQYSQSLGFCLGRAGYFAESYKVFQQLEGDASAHYNVGRMLAHVNQPELAKQHLRLALQANPQMVRAQEALDELESPAASGVPTAYQAPAAPRAN
jgi:tetratricopeptide (TPR) repeat protein